MVIRLAVIGAFCGAFAYAAARAIDGLAQILYQIANLP